jgi:phage/plasmid-associated DNA primase
MSNSPNLHSTSDSESQSEMDSPGSASDLEQLEDFSDSDSEQDAPPKREGRGRVRSSEKKGKRKRPSGKKNRRSTKRQKTEPDEKPAALLYERWNFDHLSVLAELTLDPQTEAVLCAVYEQLKDTKATRLAVSYTPREFEKGRVYGKGMQGINAGARRLGAGQYYHDVDMANSAPNLLRQVLQRERLCPPILKEYATNRAAVFQRLRGSDPRLRDVTDAALKKVFLLGVHGGKHKNNLQSLLGFPLDDTKPVAALEEWEKAMEKALKKLKRKSRFHAKLWKEVETMEDSGDKENPEGTFASWCWQVPEVEIILELSSYFQKVENYTPGALIHDGLLLERKDGIQEVPAAMLRRAEAHILKKLGWEITLVEKPFLPTEADWEMFWGERTLQKIPLMFNRAVYCLWWAGKDIGAVRYLDQVMVPHKSIPGVLVPHMPAADFINSVLRDTHAFTSVPLKQLLEWFGASDHPKFRLVTKDSFAQGIISFTNGFLNTITNQFTLWEELGDVEAPMTDHYFEQPIPRDGFDHKTPLWDSILETQIGCKPTRHFVEAMIGRLFFATGLLDNWQLCMLFLGDSNTGKGTLVKLVQKMFPKKAVGVITAGKEAGFGLESLHQRRLVVIPDMPRNFSKVLHQQDFQSMISGEAVSIARKNKVAVADEDWRVPLLAASNFFPDYKNESESVSRRLVVVHFKTLVQTRDTTLGDRIVQEELVVVLLRCLDRYRQFREEVGTADPWSCMPTQLLKARKELEINTSPLSSFLTDGDTYYQVLLKPGEITPLEELNRAYSNYMKYSHGTDRVAGIGTDYFPLKARGFEVKRVKLCKECRKESSKATCGDHYSKANRSNKMVVVNMQISKRPDEDGEDPY